MSFMEPEVYFGEYYRVETDIGSEIVPLDVSGPCRKASELRDYVTGDVKPRSALTKGSGWLARLSAPGYMDCTDWSVYDSEQEAREALAEAYGDDDSAEDDEDDDKDIVVEMYVGRMNHTWGHEFVSVPADTDEDALEELAKDKLLAMLEEAKQTDVAFVGVYHFD